MARRRYRRALRRTRTRKRRIYVGRSRSGKHYTAKLPRGLALRMHHFKQTFHPSTTYFTTNPSAHYAATGSGGVGSGTLYGPSTTDPSPAGYFSYIVVAQDLPQFSAFSAVFDAYRINKVVVKFIPLANSITSAVNTSGNIVAENQWLSTVIDYDDGVLLTTENSLLEYETFKQTPPYRRHTRAFVPALAQEAYKTSGTTIGFMQGRRKWLDAAYGDVEHYGIKGLVNGPASQTDQVQTAWKVYVTMYISFKQTR